MNGLQLCQFNILQAVLSVCEQLNVSYYLICGSALGAVKYGGFIPWDDDIDIGMLRDDYMKFVTKAPQLLPAHLFLQSYLTDFLYPQIYSKVRDSRTTYIEKNSERLNIHHGVYIDIFPLDGYPQNRNKHKCFEQKKRIFRFLCECNYDFDRSTKAKWAVNALRFFGVQKYSKYIASQYQRFISRYDASTSNLICNHGNWQGKLEYAPHWHYGKGTWATFEGLQVRVPEHYDAYLTQKYGDWRADLPADQRAGHHYYAVCDVTRPYTDYIEKLPNGKIRIKDHPTTCMQQEEPAT